MFLIRDVHAGVISEAPSLLEIFMQVLSFLLSVGGVIAVLAILFAGFMYMTAGGDSARTGLAKSALTMSVVGLVIILVSLAIVRTITSTLA